MFQKILDGCREEFDIMAGKGKGAKRSNILFSAIMRFRRVCNHGEIKIHTTAPKQGNFLTAPTMKQWSSRTSSTEPDCEFCTNETVEDDLLGALDNCPVCSQPLTEGYLNTVSATTTPQSMRSPAGSPMNIDTPEPPNTNPWFAPSIDMKRGQSSKMSAVINNIKESCLNTNLKR
ncbi:hypothetical protein FPOAC2_04330 [Fusarium poae]